MGWPNNVNRKNHPILGQSLGVVFLFGDGRPYSVHMLQTKKKSDNKTKICDIYCEIDRLIQWWIETEVLVWEELLIAYGNLHSQQRLLRKDSIAVLEVLRLALQVFLTPKNAQKAAFFTPRFVSARCLPQSRLCTKAAQKWEFLWKKKILDTAKKSPYTKMWT